MRPLLLLSSLTPGGAERVTVSFAQRMAAQGKVVPICTLTDRRDGPLAAELAETGIPRHDLGARRLADPVAGLRLARLLRRLRTEVVHAHGQDASILALAACAWTRTPLVVTRHVLDEPTDDRRQRARARLALRAIRRADRAVAVSDATADRLAQLAPMPRGRISVIRNGIDLRRFDPDALATRREGLRLQLRLRPDEPLVLVPAVLRPGKGHDLMLEAVPIVGASVPAARFAFAGGGELVQELRERVRDGGGRVELLGHREDIPELMAAADLVVLPSRAEALPTVLMEAAAAGRPVVATRVGGAPELVRHDRTGLLVPPDDARALAGGIVAMLAEPPRAAAFGRAARCLAVERFGIEHQTRATVALWEDVVAGRQR